MKLKVEKETKYNVIKGKVSHFKKAFNKIDNGLSSGKLHKVIIYEDYIELYVGEKTK